MKKDRLFKILKGLLKCAALALVLAAAAFVVIPAALFLLYPLIQQMPR